MDSPTTDNTPEEPVSGAPFNHSQQTQKSNHYGQHSKKIIPNVTSPDVAELENDTKKPIQSPYNSTQLDTSDEPVVKDAVNITPSNSVESAKEVINKPNNHDQEDIDGQDAANAIDTGEWHIPISKEAKKLDKTYRRKSIKSVPAIAIIGLVLAAIIVVAVGFFAYFML